MDRDRRSSSSVGSRRRARAVLVIALAALVAALPAGASGARRPAHARGSAQAAASCPWATSHAPIARRVADLMSHMSLADEIFLVEGHGSSNAYVFDMPGIPSLCIPQLGEEDGPSGVADQQTGVTQLPAGVALAATWDPALARQYGKVIGAEEWGKGASVNLGPTVNIDRDPRWGRSFEAYTEDPFLNSSLGVGTIEGVQSQRVMSQVKHYAAYNQETNRNTPQDDVIVSQRTLHEIYFPAFSAAIKQAKAASVMCSYSTINGKYACQNNYLLTDTLKQHWGFPGFVTSDYGALHDVSGAAAGTDQEQPENTYFGAPLQTGVSNGTIPRAVLNAMVQRMLTEMFRFNLIAQPPTGTTSATVTTPAHVAVSRRVADAGTVLLQNTGNVLPLSASHGGNVAVIGPAASASPAYGGGGSAYVIPSAPITPLQGLQAAAGAGTTISYTQGLPTDTSLPAIPASALTPAYTPTPFGGTYTGTLTAPETGTYVLSLANPCGCYTPTYLSLDGRQLLDDPGTPPVSQYSVAVNLTAGQTYAIKITGASSNFSWGTPSALAPGITAAANAARSASRAVVVVSDDIESEATDRLSLNLPSAQDELISAVAAANPHTIVVVNAGAPIAMPWRGQVAGIIDAWYPGQTSGTSLADVLFGKVNPSGHLPVTFPASLGQVPASTTAQFPGTPSGRVLYSEGLDVGYRWYDAKDLQPLFPFGFGLSYTRFAFSHLRVTPAGTDGTSDVTVSARVTNVGHRGGADIAQLYLGDPAGSGEPPRQLVGFRRVSLAPGQSARVRFTITPREEWWWSQAAGGWTQSPGTYKVYVGDSSALSDLPLRGSYRVDTTPGARQVEISTPQSVRAGHAATVTVRLTASGNETLRRVRIALQFPDGGWSARALGPTVFTGVGPGSALVARFRVKPARWEPETRAVIHATATLSRSAYREAGVTVTVRH
jgi:beta-glucosidase